MGRKIKLSLGLMALLTTLTVTCISAVLAKHISVASPARTASILSASLEALASALLVYFTWTSFSNSLKPLFTQPSQTSSWALLATAVLVCASAAAATAVNILFLSNTTRDVGEFVLRTSKNAFLTSSSILLGLSIACQIGFLALWFNGFRGRSTTVGEADSMHTDTDSSQPSISLRIKSIPYEKTRPVRSNSIDSGVAVAPSITGSIRPTSPRSSISQSIRPMSSKTRLLSLRDRQRPPSLDSVAYCHSGDGSSDVWDTTAGDQTGRGSGSDGWSPPPMKSRFLETIPASPVIEEVPSRESTPGLEPPPPVRQRSRSYSPVRRPEPPQGGEMDIHPLFRSDSPTPPPMATPGTSVVASPQAGSIIRNASNPSLRRMRSGSLHSTSSPLSRKNSFDAGSLKKTWDEQDSIREVDEEESKEHSTALSAPIPRFVLAADNRASLSEYHTRKLKGDDESESTTKPSLDDAGHPQSSP